MTLLVVDLSIPSISSTDPAELVSALAGLWPKYLSFGVSFAVIASYWSSHQLMFRYIARADGRLVWLNMLLLACIAFQPFPTSVLGAYGSTPAVTLYAGTLFVTGSVLFILMLYATRGRLLRPNLAPRLIQYRLVRAASVPLIFLVSVGIAQVNADAAKYSWLAIAVVFAVLRWAYRHAL
jgi:uncharacterized membrane protein